MVASSSSTMIDRSFLTTLFRSPISFSSKLDMETFRVDKVPDVKSE